MAFSVTPLAGITTNQTWPATAYTTAGTDGLQRPPFNLGLTVQGSDGLFYVFGKAGNSLTSAQTTISVSTTTFVATTGGGSYIAPTITGGMASGDFGWFGKASV